MNETLTPQPLDPRQLQAIQLGPAQSWSHITVFPLISAENGGPEYLTLSEALAGGRFSIAEVSAAGSVPELKVINAGDAAVLLVDGEELVGAKQNRVLNTSILLRGKSEAVIPVSCTEAGRWRSSSAFFAESGVVMSHKARLSKSSSVSASLAASAQFASDQGEVWRQIQELHRQAGTSSPTSAMLDAFKAREADLAKAMEAFPLVEHQHGLLVVVGRRVAGLDWVSRGAGYRQLHPKLLKSYLFDALVEEVKVEVSALEATALAETFLKEIGMLAGQPFSSVGLGLDHRFKGKDIAGSALMCAGCPIHLSFFRIDSQESVPPMAGLHARRRWRVE
jgi:hypothetical protein